MTEEILFEIDDNGCWTAIHTKARAEKRVLQHFQGQSIPSYLPVRRRVKKYQRRKVETLLPLFPGYVFARIPFESRSENLRFDRIARILPINRQHENMLIQELQSIYLMEKAQLLENNVIIQPELVPGTPVTIETGPMRGISGIIERREGKTRVIVNVEMLGQSVCIEVDVGEIERES